MKQCPTCNKSYDDSLKFCLADGSALSKVPELIEINTYSNLSETDKNSRRHPKPRYLYMACASLFVVIGFLSFVLIRPDSNISANTVGKTTVNSSEPAALRASNGIELSRDSAPQPPQPVQVTNSASNNPTPLPMISTPNIEGIKRDISKRINDWKEATEARDWNLLMRSYAETVDYYKKNGSSKSFVRSDKERAFLKFDSISLKVDIVSITLNPDGDQADALIDKEWLFQGSGYFSGKIQQRLQFRKIGGEWLITVEKDLPSYK